MVAPVLKCHSCGKVVAVLAAGSDWTTGTVVTCASCYKKHAADHQANQETAKKPEKKKKKATE